MLEGFKSQVLIECSDKDTEIITNSCSTDRNCTKKGPLGKFYRKQNFGQLMKKKKQPNQKNSLICYLTPNNCEESNRAIKQKFKENLTEIDINSFLGTSTSNANSWKCLRKSATNKSELSLCSNRITSIQKNSLLKNSSSKILTLSRNRLNSIDQSENSKEGGVLGRKKESMNNLKLFDVKRQEQKEIVLLINERKLQKQVRKLKTQNKHYIQQIEELNKQKTENHTQVKYLGQLINDLKSKNTYLLKAEEELSREILLLNQKISDLSKENDLLTNKNTLLQKQRSKSNQEINYLKQTIKELNQRIQLILQSGHESSLMGKNQNFQKTDSDFVQSNIEIILGKKWSSMCFVSDLQRKSMKDLNQDENKLIHQLRDELKYCHVEISMLKRVKMDINKKNQEFLRLQRQNQILKNKILDMKIFKVIEQQTDQKTPLVLSKNIRKHSPITKTLQKQKDSQEARDFDNRSDYKSSDTLSLNLSLSPQKQRIY